MQQKAATSGLGQYSSRSIGKTVLQGLAVLGPWIMLIVAVVVPSIFLRQFGTQRNLINVLMQASIYIPLVVGMTFVITGGGIDLSVGAQVALIGVLTGSWLDGGSPVWIAMIGALALGTLFGTINGFFITAFRFPDFIVTLAFMEIFRGLALVHSTGNIWFGFPPSFRALVTTRYFEVIPLALIVVFAITAIGAWMYKSTYFGRYAIAIGGNKHSAATVGIPVRKYKVLQYALMGFMCGVATILLMGRIDSAQATMATGYEIHVIAATIIGGTSLFGGKGSVWGSLIGAVILAIIANALILLGVPVFWRLVATGVVILIAVGLNMLRERFGY